MVNLGVDHLLNSNEFQVAQVGRQALETMFNSLFGISGEHPKETFHMVAQNENYLAKFYSEWIPVGGVISYPNITSQVEMTWQSVLRFESVVGMEIKNDLTTMRYFFKIVAVKLKDE